MAQAGHQLAPPLPVRSIENPKHPLAAYFDEPASISGAVVNPMTAMQSTAIWAAIRIIAGSVAKLPLLTYRRTDTGRERDREHYLHRLLQETANPEMTAYRFRHLMQTWLLVHGNAYAAIEINGRGQVTALFPMKPSRVNVKVSKTGIRYEYTSDDGQTISIASDLVFHLRWMSDDGIIGRSPIQVHRDTIGLGLAQTEARARFFGNGMKISGVLTHPERLGDKAHENLRKQFANAHQGLANAWKMMILEEGMKYEPTQSTMADAEFVSQMKFGIADIARIYGVPLHMLSELDRSTNNNIEHQGLEFVAQTLDEHLTNWETEIGFALLSERDRKAITCEHLLDKLLRGDTKSRYDAFGVGIDKGFLKVNEVRAKENLNAVEGGDVPRQQMQMVPLGYMPPEPKPQGAINGTA
jgi:HK97 family phage portal protein